MLAYRVFCPDDPAKLDGRQQHRALSDALAEAHILRALIDLGTVDLGTVDLDDYIRH